MAGQNENPDNTVTDKGVWNEGWRWGTIRILGICDACPCMHLKLDPSRVTLHEDKGMDKVTPKGPAQSK
jgi:hypothetical protein